MSKTNDTGRELRDDELQKVSGGRINAPFTMDMVVATPFSIDIGTSENLVVRRP